MEYFTIVYFTYLICLFQPDCMRFGIHRQLLLPFFLLTFYWSYIEVDNYEIVLWLRYTILAQMIQIGFVIAASKLHALGWISSRTELIIQIFNMLLQIPSGWLFV